MALSSTNLVLVTAVLLFSASLEVSCQKKQPRPANRQRHVIDVHTHLDPAVYDKIHSAMDRLGIERAVNLSGGYEPREMQTLGKWQRSHGNRIIHFFNIPFEYIQIPDWSSKVVALLHQAVEQGYGGIKISKTLGLHVKAPDGSRLPIDSPLLDPIFQAAAELKLPVAIHSADPVAFFSPATPDNERYDELQLRPGWSFADPIYPRHAQLMKEFENLVARHPAVTFIGVHFGNNAEDIGFVDRMLKTYSNYNIDVAARLGEFGRHPRNAVRSFFIRHQERILFGTDLMYGRDSINLGSVSSVPPQESDLAPFFEKHFEFFESDHRKMNHPVPIQGNWTIDALDLPTDVLDKLYFKNAERLIFARYGAPSTATVPGAK